MNREKNDGPDRAIICIEQCNYTVVEYLIGLGRILLPYDILRSEARPRAVFRDPVRTGACLPPRFVKVQILRNRPVGLRVK